MPGITRDNDTCSADISPSQHTVYANNEKVIVDGDSVAGHGADPHDAPTMQAGSNKVYIGGIAVVNAGDSCTCGHTATGSSDVYVGDPVEDVGD